MIKDNLGDRMKRYEAVSKSSLVSRMPVILRLDGCHFHTFSRGFVKPFDEVLMTTMQETMQYLCENIQGCVFGYTQSDEITLVLVDYKKLNSSAWYDNEVQKMCSVAAAMCSMKFNELFQNNANHFISDVKMLLEADIVLSDEQEDRWTQYTVYRDRFNTAYFDCRAFNVPKEEVCNCVLWRQKDAERNSINSLAQTYFSHKELMCKKRNEVQDMLYEQKGVNWNDLDIDKKRGACCYRIGETSIPEDGSVGVTRMFWCIDRYMPILSKDRNFVEQWVYVGE